MRTAIFITLLCLVAYVSADHHEEHKCECTGFFKGHLEDDHKIFSSPVVNMESCDDAHKETCKEKCHTAYNTFTGEGDLAHITSEGNTVSAYACKKFHEDITDGELGAYFKMCGGEWTHVESVKGKTCCHDNKDITCA